MPPQLPEHDAQLPVHDEPHVWLIPCAVVLHVVAHPEHPIVEDEPLLDDERLVAPPVHPDLHDVIHEEHDVPVVVANKSAAVLATLTSVLAADVHDVVHPEQPLLLEEDELVFIALPLHDPAQPEQVAAQLA